MVKELPLTRALLALDLFIFSFIYMKIEYSNCVSYYIQCNVECILYTITVNVSRVCVGALDAVASMSTQMSQLQDTPQESLQGECTCH